MNPSPERRRWCRSSPGDAAAARVRFVGGADGRVVDVSKGGVSVQSTQRTAPGRPVLLQWPSAPERGRAQARVVRTHVARLAGEAGVEYAIGLEFVEAPASCGERATRRG